MKKRIFTFMAMLMLSATFDYSAAAALSVPASDPDPVTVKMAMEEFMSLSRKEKKALLKKAKKEIRLYKAERRADSEPSTNTLLLVILAILLPPLAVYLHDGAINSHFWISLILTLLFWLPGVIYALIIVLG